MNWVSIGSDNGLSPIRRQAITWTNAGKVLTEPLGTNVSEILTKLHTFSFKKMHLKTSSAKRRPFCPGLNMLITYVNPLENAIAIIEKFTGLHSSCSYRVAWSNMYQNVKANQRTKSVYKCLDKSYRILIYEWHIVQFQSLLSGLLYFLVKMNCKYYTKGHHVSFNDTSSSYENLWGRGIFHHCLFIVYDVYVLDYSNYFIIVALPTRMIY